MAKLTIDVQLEGGGSPLERPLEVDSSVFKPGLSPEGWPVFKNVSPLDLGRVIRPGKVLCATVTGPSDVLKVSMGFQHELVAGVYLSFHENALSLDAEAWSLMLVKPEEPKAVVREKPRGGFEFL